MYLFRIYLIEEYEINASTRKEAIKKLEQGEYEEIAQWEYKWTLRKSLTCQGNDRRGE